MQLVRNITLPRERVVPEVTRAFQSIQISLQNLERAVNALPDDAAAISEIRTSIQDLERRVPTAEPQRRRRVSSEIKEQGMTLAMDANFKTLMLREQLCVGEFLSLADGADEKPVGTDWVRLMPHNDDAELVDDEEKQLDITSVRDTILSIEGWNLEILNVGYQQKHQIVEYNADDGIATFAEPIRYAEGLDGLSGIEYVLYPTVEFPLCVRFISSTANNQLEIGVTNADVYDPDTIVKYEQVKQEVSILLPTRQVQQIFYSFTGTRSQADAADITLSWGEHYTRGS